MLKDLKFFISGEVANPDECKRLIKELNGSVVSDLSLCTHIITLTSCQQYDALITTPTWLENVYNHKKLYPLYRPRSMFAGFFVHCSSVLTERDIKAIYEGVEAGGGERRLEISDQVTHVVTKEEIKGLKCKQVVPEYFDDCFRLNCKFDDRQYRFPDPNIWKLDFLDQTNFKKEVKKEGLQKMVVSNPKLFQGDIFYIDADIELSSNFSASIVRFHGQITENIKDAGIVVVERRNEIYMQAIELGLQVGNRRWLRDQMFTQIKTYSKDCILHYPYPIEGVEEFSDMIISVTNYVTNAREDIVKMATRLGAQFTRTMTAHNTHLICGSATGEKFMRATAWNMHIVNHFWLEESYSTWMYQKEGNPRFLHFTPLLGTMVGLSPMVDVAVTMSSQKSNSSSKRSLQTATMEPVPKKAKVAPRKQILFTGTRPTSENLALIKSLGFDITDAVNDADVLVALKIGRTEKFLLALSKGIPLVGLGWIKHLYSTLTWPDPALFPLIDLKGEASFKFKIKAAMERSASKKLFKGYTLYFTPKIEPSLEVMQRLVTAAGGQFGDLITLRNVNDLVLKSRVDDKVLLFCSPTEKMIFKNIKLVTIYTPELVLNGILKQEIDLTVSEHVSVRLT